MIQLLLIIAVLAQGTKGERVKEKFLHDNQIMFRESGIVVNKAVFVHVRFEMEMGPTLDAITEVGKKLENVHLAELNNSKVDILPYLMGSEGNDSIWRQDEASELWRKRSMDGVAISGMLYNMFNRSAAGLASALGVIPPKYTINTGYRFHERTKRYATTANGGNVTEDTMTGYRSQRRKRFLSLGAYGMAGSNMFRINNLEKSFKNFTSKYNKLVDYVQDLSGKHIQLAVDTALLKDLVLLLNHKNYHKIITLVMTLQDQLKDTIVDVKAITREGNRGRMASEMLGGGDLISFYERLEEMAKEKNCRMVTMSPSDLYELDATYGYDANNRSFIVYLHVPMYQVGEELKLWEYVPFPILQSLTLNATIVPQTGKENFIALMPDATIRTNDLAPAHRFRIFNEYDLNICRRIRNIYLCGGRNTLRTDITDSCIGNLYLRDHGGIARTCDLEIGKLEEYVAKIGPNNWIVFSPEPFYRTAICSGETESVRFETQTILELPEDCKINLKSTQLTTDININVEYKIQRFEWKYNGNIFEELQISDENLAVLMQEMISTKSKFGLKDLNHLKHYFEYTDNELMKMFDSISDMFNMFGFLSRLSDIIVPILVIMIGIGIFFIMVRFGLLRRVISFVNGSNRLTRLPEVGMQLRAALAERENSISGVSQAQMIQPPPYHSMEIPSSAPARLETGFRRTESMLSVDSRYEPALIREEREIERQTMTRECNPGPTTERGLRREDFVCTQHLIGRSGLCAGYYRLPRDRPRNIRFQDPF